MKKITFILFALVAGTAFAQESDSAIANATADIVSPISINKEVDLTFGKVANNTAGTVVVATDNSVGTSSLSQIGTTSPTAASFSVTAAKDYAYTITLPTAAVTLTNVSDNNETMTVDTFKHDAGGTPKGTGAVQTVNVGATLNVGSSQATGTYRGQFTVSVDYE
ncbi:DUF4402 domain-containing protein [Salinimicrobium soli]|uniref:DUF4402 domain-containing protein n=1 Tax=Salinimicrobium soli TaxID=1254399 RepID=UPI003AAE2105